MTDCTRALADFVHDTTFEHLPAEVVDYTKLVILDSLICGIAAGPMERTQMMHAVLAGLGTGEEACVFGLGRRAPALGAAMANAEAMNLLDADDTFFSSNHFAAFSVAAALAEAQRLGASGQSLIRSVALGFDVNARMNLALLLMDEVDGRFQWASVAGMGFAAFGTAASAAVVIGLDREQTRNLFGLAAWMAPGPVASGVATRRQFGSLKYGSYGGTTHAGMLAARLAAQGYTCEQDCLDTTPGFFDAQGSVATDRELLVAELGQKWWILETALKPYPSCRYTHGPIDMLRRLMREQRLEAADIERIEVHLNPMAYALSLFRDPVPSIAADHRAPLNGAFHIPYVMALVALGRPPGPAWYARESLQDPRVWELASRIHTRVDEGAKDEVVRAFRETRIRRFRKTRGALTVWARGQRHECTSEYCAGDPWSPETRATWESIARKLDDFCADLMDPPARADLIERVRHLESMPDVSAGLRLP